ATAYFDRRRFLESAETFERAVKLNDKNHTIWGNLGDAYYWAPGKRSQAAEAYRRAIVLAEERLKINPRDAAVLGQLAGYHAMNGEKQAALTILDQALRLKPADAELLYKSAIVYNQLDEVDQALGALEKAVRAGYTWTAIRDAP